MTKNTKLKSNIKKLKLLIEKGAFSTLKILNIKNWVFFRREIDLAALALTITPERSQDFQFLHPIGKEGMYLVSRISKTQVVSTK